MENLKIFTDNIEKEALDQIHRLLSQDAFSDAKIRIMPDVHAGKGCVIGFTGDLGNKVIPSIVGVDIGCGILVAQIGTCNIDYKKLDDFIHAQIPSGFSVNKTSLVPFDLKQLRCYSSLRNIEWVENSIGSLGGGNHFIEIDEGEDKMKYLTIHTGSRNLGSQVAEIYQMRADEICNHHLLERKKKREELILQYKEEGRMREIQGALALLEKEFKAKEETENILYDLAYLEGKEREDYLFDMKLCQEFALLNRFNIAERIFSYMGWDLSHYFESVHNYISFTDNIIRKGSISANFGEKLIIPINMRDGCIIGYGKGNDDWNRSAPHGAGRIMSRSKAASTIKLDDYQDSMKGIYTTSVNKETIDESPFAYKSMKEIIEHIKPSVAIERIIKPVYNFKASEKPEWSK